MSTEEKLETNMADLSKASGQITYLESKVENLENRSWRKNLRMFGLREGEEGSRQLLDYVQEMLPGHCSKVHDIKHNGNKLSFAQDFSTETMRQRREFNAVKKLFIDTGSF